MMAFIKVIVLIVNIISLVSTVLFLIWGLYEEIVGPAGAEKLLKKLHIPLNCNQMLIAGIASVVLMWGSHILSGRL